MKNGWILGILMIAEASSFGSGWQQSAGRESGGGSAIWSGGKLVLADPFVFNKAGEVDIPAPLVAYLKRAQFIANGYRIDNLDAFFDKEVFGLHVKIVMKEDLPCTDDPIEGVDAPQVLYGCTDTSGTTYLKPSVFGGMSPHDQAMGILHERLHVLGWNHTRISAVVTGLSTALRVYGEQADNLWRALSRKELAALDRFFGLMSLKDFEITPHGGIVSGAVSLLGDSNRIGIGSTLASLPNQNGRDSTPMNVEDSTLLNSIVLSISSDFGEARIARSTFIDSAVYRVIEIYDSKLLNSALTTSSKNWILNAPKFPATEPKVRPWLLEQGGGVWVLNSTLKNVSTEPARYGFNDIRVGPQAQGLLGLFHTTLESKEISFRCRADSFKSAFLERDIEKAKASCGPASPAQPLVFTNLKYIYKKFGSNDLACKKFARQWMASPHQTIDGRPVEYFHPPHLMMNSECQYDSSFGGNIGLLKFHFTGRRYPETQLQMKLSNQYFNSSKECEAAKEQFKDFSRLDAYEADDEFKLTLDSLKCSLGYEGYPSTLKYSLIFSMTLKMDEK